MTLQVQVAIDWDNDGSWTTAGDDLSDYFQSVRWQRGFGDPYSTIARVGTCTLKFDNTSRIFSPAYAGGGYYNKLLPNLPVRVQVTDGTTAWTIFRGVTKSFEPEAGRYGGRSAVIQCEDMLGVMQQVGLSIPVFQERSADYLLKIIGATAFKTAARDWRMCVVKQPADSEYFTLNRAGGVYGGTSTTYTFKTALSPAANEVLIGATKEATASNLADAINNDDETLSTGYASGTVRGGEVSATDSTGTVYTGATTTITATGSSIPVGPSTDLGLVGQRFRVTAGMLTQLTIKWAATTGAPTSTVTWRITQRNPANRFEDVENPDDYASGTLTPTGGGTDTVNVAAANQFFMTADTDYFLTVNPTTGQAAGNYWNWQCSTTSTYASGELIYYSGGAWVTDTDKDGQCSVTTGAVTPANVDLIATARGTWANSIAFAKSGKWYLAYGNVTAGVDGPVGLMSYEAGKEVFPYAGDRWNAERTNALSAAEEVVTSEWGLLWCAKDGTVTFKNRDWFFEQQATAATLTLDDQPNDVSGRLSVEDVFNSWSVTYAPRAPQAIGVIAKATRPIRILNKSGTKRYNPVENLPSTPGFGVVRIPYADQTSGEINGALDLITPIGGTDYTAKINDGLAGLDVTDQGYLSVSVAINGGDVEASFVNTSIRHVYIFDFQVRGTMLLGQEPITVLREDTTSITAYNRRTRGVNLPLPVGVHLAPALAEYLVNRYKDARFRAGSMNFAGQTTVGTVNLFARDIGEVVSLTEYQLGLSAQRYLISSIDGQIDVGSKGSITFGLRKLDELVYGIWDDATYGIWDTSKWSL
jgi:hypothetical protein